MKYLKTRKDSGALAFQRAVGKRFKVRARALGISDPIVMPLNISQGAPDTDIAAALQRCNEQYETLKRFLAQTDIRAVQKAELEEAAKAYVEIKGVMPGDLYGVDSLDGAWDATIDAVFGHHQYQDHPEYKSVYPQGTLIPDELRDAILAILQERDGSKQFHLYSQVFEAYKENRRERIAQNSSTLYEEERKLRELKKDIRRLDDFYAFVGNQEFSTENCNEDLHRYRRHLLDQYPKPATAKRHHEVPCAALRWYADEFVPSVVIRTFTFQGQRATTAARPVFDVDVELPLLWQAAHDPSYHHLFRLAIFGIFSGAGASELVQSQVGEVRPKQGYYILNGSKTAHRSRPAIIINKTHERLLIKYGTGSIVGEKIAHQSSSNHSKIIKDGLFRATGNDKLSAYSGRHTGKHLCDLAGVGASDVVRVMFGWNEGGYAIANNYARAGHFSDHMITEMKKVVALMIGDLPDLDHLDRTQLHGGNVINMRW